MDALVAKVVEAGQRKGLGWASLPLKGWLNDISVRQPDREMPSCPRCPAFRPCPPVQPPTMTASERARISNTCCRDWLLLTQALCPVWVAILPSSVIAYLSSPRGRCVTARCSSASLANRQASSAASCCSVGAAQAASPRTATATPAARSAAMAPPRRCGSGWRKPTTTRATPASTRASTAA